MLVGPPTKLTIKEALILNILRKNADQELFHNAADANYFVNRLSDRLRLAVLKAIRDYGAACV